MTHHPGSVETMKQTAAEVTLCDDLLRGADQIAKFIFGDAKHRRKVYYLTGEAAKGLPHVQNRCQRQSKSEPKGSAKCYHFGVGEIAA